MRRFDLTHKIKNRTYITRIKQKKLENKIFNLIVQTTNLSGC